MYVCICHAVTDKTIEKAAQNGVRSMRQLRLKTGCSGTCGQCATMAKSILEAHQAPAKAPSFTLPILPELQPA